MANGLKSLVKDTALYGISSIVGRFLNYLLVPLYTIKITAESGGYGVVTNVYAYTALLLVLLTFGMETTLFRFSTKEGEEPRKVYGTVLWLVTLVAVVFAVLLVALPLIYVLGTSLTRQGQDFSFGATFTLANYKSLMRADYLLVFFNSLKLAFLTTVVSLLIGYPFGYFMARRGRRPARAR